MKLSKKIVGALALLPLVFVCGFAVASKSSMFDGGVSKGTMWIAPNGSVTQIHYEITCDGRTNVWETYQPGVGGIAKPFFKGCSKNNWD